ncbi:MAG: hypothetical protein K9L30_15870 [Desulfobacterales bacterium]|nr:hypothetical protein [Desulfobacterales bacterium]
MKDIPLYGIVTPSMLDGDSERSTDFGKLERMLILDTTNLEQAIFPTPKIPYPMNQDHWFGRNKYNKK